MNDPAQTDFIEGDDAPVRKRTRISRRSVERETPKPGEQPRSRDGEVLTRRRVAGVDEFDIPKGLVPPGWTYQWNTVTVYNNADLVVGQTMQMYENGWRPVPASRHPGKFVPIGTKGDIIRGGMRLEERPESMTDEARAEDVAVARRQMTDRDESLMGGKAAVRNLPPGMEMGGKYRGTGGSLKMNIDPALDIPAPSHKLAEPGE
jgi:hypothetical protein